MAAGEKLRFGRTDRIQNDGTRMFRVPSKIPESKMQGSAWLI